MLFLDTKDMTAIYLTDAFSNNIFSGKTAFKINLIYVKNKRTQ